MHILIYISFIGCVSQTSMDSTDLEIVFKDSGQSIFLDVESSGKPSPVATIFPSVEEEPPSTTHESKAPPAVPEHGAHSDPSYNSMSEQLWEEVGCGHQVRKVQATESRSGMCECAHFVAFERALWLHVHQYVFYSPLHVRI